jgi:hypothetical protein
MLLAQRLQTRGHPLQFGVRFGPGTRLRYIALGAFKLDFRAAAGTLVLQVHFIVTDHPLDQLVPRDHPFPGALKFSGFLGSDLWPALAGIHMHYSRSTFGTDAEHLAADFLRDENGAPMDVPTMQIMKRIVGLAEFVFFGMEVDETAIRERHQFD